MDIASLPRWVSSPLPGPPTPSSGPLPNAHVISPFPVREDLNSKVALWSGDLSLLGVEAVVNPTNESITDKNPVSARLFEVAGPELREECRTQVGSCRTGEARITGGYQLPARHVIHTVGPRYNIRYKTAAESALYNCYRSVMTIVRTRHLASVAFHTLSSSRRGYPPDEGANIAIRTIRRFLERYEDEVDLIVFVSDTPETVYSRVLPLYFPRTKEEEEFATRALPADIGNEMGEPVIAERMIRILDNPVGKEDELAVSTSDKESSPPEGEGEGSWDEEEEGGLVSQVGSHPFSSMTADHDQERREQIVRSGPPTEEETQIKMYQSYLRRARTENFSEFIELDAFYKAGLDYMGRQIVVYVGKNFPAPKFDLSKAIAYFVHVMERIVHRDYVIVYFHTDSVPENQPDSSFFKQLYTMVDNRYRNNLRAIYMVHPTWWFKLSAWWFLTFTASELKDKIQYLTGVQYLYDTINPDQIEIPPFVLDHDKELNGLNYYTPASRGEDGTGGL